MHMLRCALKISESIRFDENLGFFFGIVLFFSLSRNNF